MEQNCFEILIQYGEQYRKFFYTFRFCFFSDEIPFFTCFLVGGVRDDRCCFPAFQWHWSYTNGYGPYFQLEFWGFVKYNIYHDSTDLSKTCGTFSFLVLFLIFKLILLSRTFPSSLLIEKKQKFSLAIQHELFNDSVFCMIIAILLP